MSSWVGHDKMVHVGGLGKVLALVRLNWSTSTSSGYPLGVIHAASRVSCETSRVVFESLPCTPFIHMHVGSVSRIEVRLEPRCSHFPRPWAVELDC